MYYGLTGVVYVPEPDSMAVRHYNLDSAFTREQNEGNESSVVSVMFH
jgi:hypothetical protein